MENFLRKYNCKNWAEYRIKEIEKLNKRYERKN